MENEEAQLKEHIRKAVKRRDRVSDKLHRWLKEAGFDVEKTSGVHGCGETNISFLVDTEHGQERIEIEIDSQYNVPIVIMPCYHRHPMFSVHYELGYKKSDFTDEEYKAMVEKIRGFFKRSALHQLFHQISITENVELLEKLYERIKESLPKDEFFDNLKGEIG